MTWPGSHRKSVAEQKLEPRLPRVLSQSLHSKVWQHVPVRPSHRDALSNVAAEKFKPPWLGLSYSG